MITITGASGKTGSGVAEILLVSGEKVRVIGRSAERLETFRKKGADIAVGDQGNAEFFTETLEDADALYLLIPPKFDTNDFRAYYNRLGDAAVTAIERSGVGKVVFLSSLGAEKPAGTGPVVGLHDVEKKLEQLADIDTVFLRPAYFMENLLGNMDMIRTQAMHGAPIPGNVPVMMAATADIAAKAAELLMDRSFTGHTFTEIIGDRITFNQVTEILDALLGIPSLNYVWISDIDALAVFSGMGLSQSVANSYVELMHAIADGTLSAIQTGPGELTAPTRFSQFAQKVFKPAFETSMEHATV
jgi:uncharacterized protein YbjT (DUF2867 family)